MNEPGSWIRQRCLALVGSVLVLSCAGAVVSLGATWHWAADLAANLRMQQLIALLGVTLCVVMLSQWRWLLAVTLVAGLHLPFLWPSMISPRPKFEAVVPVLTLMSANVLTGNAEHERVIAACETHCADVIVILELSYVLAEKLDNALRASHPYRKVLPQEFGNFGIGLYSNEPLQTVDVFSTIDDVTSIEVTLEHAGKPCRLIATHPLPPIGALRYRERNLQLDEIAKRALRSANLPCIVVGDLNLTPWSPVFARFAKNAGLRRATAGNAVTPTWYAGPKSWFPMGLALDHALINDRLECLRYQVGEPIGSDHRPVIWDFAIREAQRASS